MQISINNILTRYLFKNVIYSLSNNLCSGGGNNFKQGIRIVKFSYDCDVKMLKHHIYTISLLRLILYSRLYTDFGTPRY